MSATEGHEFSTLVLDVYWASGQAADAALERHLRECARCRAYLEHLARLEGSSPGGLAGALPRPRVSPLRRLRALRAWAAPMAGALALAAAIVLLVHTRASSPAAGYVGVKGTPAVQLLLHRGSDTHVWDGAERVRPGDALALRVACEGLVRVAVAALDHDRWQRLSDSSCPRGDEPLPFTLVVDGEGESERLAVVLSDDALDDARLRGAIAANERTTDLWVVDFILTNDTETDR
jgi:hypothetical protein